MALTPELQHLISEIHNFMTVALSGESLSENTEDKRADIITKLSPYLSQHLSVNKSQLSQSMNATDLLRTKTGSTPFLHPEPPKAPPPGEVKKVNPKDLKSSALFEGIIEKLGGKNQEKWQKRYCILTQTYLYFFENSKCKHQNNQIYIPAFSITPVKERGNEKHKAFRLSSKSSKSYYFRVQDSELYAGWFGNISQLSANSGSVARAETMIFNSDEFIATASSSDEGETVKERDEESPPPVPPPTTSIPKSPQFLRKTTPTAPPPTHQPPPPLIVSPPPLVMSPPPLIVSPPPVTAPHPVQQPMPDVVRAKTALTNQNSEVIGPPPAPKRHGSVLNPGPGVSVQQMRKIIKKKDSVILEDAEDGDASRGVSVDTERLYETTDEEDFPYDKIYAAKWDFRGEVGDELTFKRGDLILVADPNASNPWWIGDLLHSDTLLAKDQSGLFYSVYVESAFVKV